MLNAASYESPELGANWTSIKKRPHKENLVVMPSMEYYAAGRRNKFSYILAMWLYHKKCEVKKKKEGL
jgi:hypothetical protein